MHRWLRTHAVYYPHTIIGENPVELVNPIEVDVEDNTNTWFRMTRNSLQKASVSATPSKLLPLIFSLPHIAARKSLDALQLAGRISLQKETPLGVSREEVTRAVQKVYGEQDPELYALYQDLIHAKQVYLSFLMEEVATGSIGVDSYNDKIQQMARDSAPKALELLARMHYVFNGVGEPVYDGAQVAKINSREKVHRIYSIY